MAWNRPTESGEAVSRPLQKRAGDRFPVRGAIAGAIVVVGAGIAAWWLWPNGEGAGEAPPSRKEGLIKEVKPQIATNIQVEAESLPLAMKRDHSELTVKELLTKVPHWAYSVEDRKRIDPGYAERHERFLKRQEANPWKTYADNALARLLFNNGNLGLLPRFNDKFVRAFQKSIETPIIVSKDDPPDLQERKRALIETKIWLKDQMSEGKDIVKILNEEYDKQKKISGMRENLRQELIKLRKTAKSVQEIDDYITAANKMLQDAGDEKGIKMSNLKVRARLLDERPEKETK